jgi:hypothetical protein
VTLRFADGGNIPVTYLTWIDDVQITSVPEPASGVFVLIATVAFLLIRARRRATK